MSIPTVDDAVDLITDRRFVAFGWTSTDDPVEMSSAILQELQRRGADALQARVLVTEAADRLDGRTSIQHVQMGHGTTTAHFRVWVPAEALRTGELRLAHVRLNSVPQSRGVGVYVYFASLYEPPHEGGDHVRLEFQVSDRTRAIVGLDDDTFHMLVERAIRAAVDGRIDHWAGPVLKQAKAWRQPIVLGPERFPDVVRDAA